MELGIIEADSVDGMVASGTDGSVKEPVDVAARDARERGSETRGAFGGEGGNGSEDGAEEAEEGGEGDAKEANARFVVAS